MLRYHKMKWTPDYYYYYYYYECCYYYYYSHGFRPLELVIFRLLE